MKGGPTDPPNAIVVADAEREVVASMKGGPTDPPNQAEQNGNTFKCGSFNEGGAY